MADRDGWICHRCLRPIDRALQYPHPLALVADHYPVPLSDGGPTIPANLRAAHSLCNGSHLGLGATPEPPEITALITAGLLHRARYGYQLKYSITPKGKRALARWERDGGDARATLVCTVRGTLSRVPDWWDSITDAERDLASEIMKLPLDRNAAVLPSDRTP